MLISDFAFKMSLAASRPTWNNTRMFGMTPTAGLKGWVGTKLNGRVPHFLPQYVSVSCHNYCIFIDDDCRKTLTENLSSKDGLLRWFA